VIRRGKLSVAEKNMSALKDAKPPMTQSELRSFLGLFNVYRRFVAGFAKIAAPLNAFLRKGEIPTLRQLTPEQMDAFNTLRERLLRPPVLALPRAEGTFTLDTDALQDQIGCCLLQARPDGATLPIGYWNRGLTSAERNYSTTEKECLAIVWAILQLRPYLEGKRFVDRTDHHSLRWVLNLSDAPQGRLARWRLRLLEFDFEVQYTPGRAHHGADTMSRLRPGGHSPCVADEPVDAEIPCFALAPVPDPHLLPAENLRALQETDPDCQHLLHHFGCTGSLDYDPSGTLGHVLPSGEFQVQLPRVLATSAPVTVYEEAYSGREDAPILKREE
jgi:hypothetical protein